MEPIKACAVTRGVVEDKRSGVCWGDKGELSPIDEVRGNLDFIWTAGNGVQNELSLSVDWRPQQFQPNAGRVIDFVQPSGIGAPTGVLIFGIAPAQGVGARWDIEGLEPPICFSREAIGLEIAIDVKLKEIKIGLGRGSPPESQPARTGDTGAQPGFLIVIDIAALGGRDTIMSYSGLAEPWSTSPGNPIEIGIVENLRRNGARCNDCYGDRLRAF